MTQPPIICKHCKKRVSYNKRHFFDGQQCTEMSYNDYIARVNRDSIYTPYFTQLAKRLEAGRQQYGDKSFEKTNIKLIEEIQEEVLDIAGWGFILWKKLETLKEKAIRL